MDTRTGAVAPERRWRLSLALYCLGTLIGAFAASCLTVPLPLVAGDLHTSTGLASASVIVYLLVISGLFLFFGKLGDVWGYRRVFLAGTAAFTLGSFLCGIPETVDQLILFRIVQAVGATMVAAVGIPFVSRHVPDAWHGRGFAYLSGAAMLGVILGPTLGVAIADILTWHWIFFASGIVGIAIIATGYITLPSGEETSRGRRFDLTGACLFSCATLSLVLAISSVHAFGIASLVTAGLVLFTIAFWTLAIVYESATEDPAFEITLFRNRDFTHANISFVLVKMAINGPVFLFPFYLHLVLGYSYELTGFLVIVPGAVMLLATPGVGLLTDRFRARTLCIAGSSAIAAVYLLFAGFTPGITLITALLALIFLGVVRGIFLVPNTKLIMDQSPADMKGAASGVMKALGNTGIILGIVIFQIAFSETLLAGQAIAQHTDPFTIPMPAIAAGFQAAFVLAGALSLAAAFFAWYARDVLPADAS
ncbi:MAG: MFS transporter [Methanoregula sp.]|jgi:MFS family permease|uniref:MFS transporter n=1 Tax=Methanoregula sp. TaxID=2052170 RepID=UPI003D14ADF9